MQTTYAEVALADVKEGDRATRDGMHYTVTFCNDRWVWLLIADIDDGPFPKSDFIYSREVTA